MRVRPTTLHLLTVLTVAATTTASALTVTIQLRDTTTQQPTAARLLVRDSGGWLFSEPDPIQFTRFHPGVGPYIHAEDAIDLDVAPGPLDIWAVRGQTGVPIELELNVAADTTVVLQLTQWVDPTQWGWIGADPHVHPWHEGNAYPEPPLEHIGLMARAEALDLMCLLANDPAHPSGRVLPAQPGAELEWGEEYRNSFWGHLVLLDLSQLIQTEVGYGCCGSIHSAWPPNQWTLENYDPPLVLLAHPVPGLDPRRTDGWPGSGFAREMYSLAADDGVDGIAVAGAGENGRNGWVLEEYLDVLRGGARWAAIGEGDRGLNRHSLPPPGVIRTYVHAGGGYPIGASEMAAAWKAGILQRRTFATTGPFLRSFSVDRSEIGSEMSLAGPGSVALSFDLESIVPLGRVTIHGATGIHWEQLYPGGQNNITVTLPLAVAHDDFFVLEAEGIGGSWSTDPRGTRLVSSPIWVEMDDPWPIAASLSRRGADNLIESWDRSLRTRGYDTTADSAAAHALLWAGKTYWEAMYDEEPGEFALVWPEDGHNFANTQANLRWNRSRSYDGETTSYEVELDDLDDGAPSFVATTTTDTTASIPDLMAGHLYSWAVHAYEPGEGPTTSNETRSFRIAANGVTTEAATTLSLSPPEIVAGVARARLELPNANDVVVRWIDLRGRLTRRESTRRPAGTQTIEWNLRDGSGSQVANGVYWLVVESGDERISRRLVVLR